MTCAVVTSIKGSDGASRDLCVVAAIDVGHVAAAEHIAFDGATIDMDYGPTHGIDRERREIGGSVITETHWCQVTACIDIAFNSGSSSHDCVGFIVGRYKQSHIVFVGIINTRNIVEVTVAMIEAVGTGEEVFIDCAARGFDVGAALYLLISHCVGCRGGVDTGAAHVATHVAAAKHTAHMSTFDLHPGAVVDITHTAAAIDVVNQHGGAVQPHKGAVVDAIAVDGAGYMRQHVASVAAAVYGAHAARGEGDGRYAVHGCLVVAAIKVAHVIDAFAVPSVVVLDGDVAAGIGTDGV